MRLLSILLISLASGCCAFAQDQLPPAAPHEGACEPPSHDEKTLHPSEIEYERRCILKAKPFAVRSGDELRLTFRNGTARTYKNTANSKACQQDQTPYESCKGYVLHDYFPEHEILLVNVGYYESQVWLLIRAQNGKEEKVVAPPRYSPDRKWLASVYATEGPDDGNNGIDIVPTRFDSTERSWRYRPEKYELWNFVRWNGNERLALTVYWRPSNEPELVTWPAEVVHSKGAWQFNRWAPTARQP